MRVGIITGSGTYALPGLRGRRGARGRGRRFGSAPVTEGAWAGADVVHVSRHGEGHAPLSSPVTHQANVVALKEAGADGVLAVTVCGSLDPQLELGTLIVFDDLHFPPTGCPTARCARSTPSPAIPGRGHWIFDRPFAPALRAALLAGARAAGHPSATAAPTATWTARASTPAARSRSCRPPGVTAVSQTAGPETVLCGEAELPYALVGYATDYANGVPHEPTPVRDARRADRRSGAIFAADAARGGGRIGAPPPRDRHALPLRLAAASDAAAARPTAARWRASRPSTSASSLAQAICGWMRPPRPQSVAAMTFSRPAASAKRSMRSATSCGCSTTLVAWLTMPGTSTRPSQVDVLPHPPLVLVADVGRLEGERADVDLQQHVDDVGHRDVGGVRAMPAAPAAVEARAARAGCRAARG